jgi:hypothetical protein
MKEGEGSRARPKNSDFVARLRSEGQRPATWFAAVAERASRTWPGLTGETSSTLVRGFGTCLIERRLVLKCYTDAFVTSYRVGTADEFATQAVVADCAALGVTIPDRSF